MSHTKSIAQQRPTDTRTRRSNRNSRASPTQSASNMIKLQLPSALQEDTNDTQHIDKNTASDEEQQDDNKEDGFDQQEMNNSASSTPVPSQTSSSTRITTRSRSVDLVSDTVGTRIPLTAYGSTRAKKQTPNTTTSTSSSPTTPETTTVVINAQSPGKSGSKASQNTDIDRESRTGTLSRKEQRKQQRERNIKQKLAELDRLEESVKTQSHIEYKNLLREIEEKRKKQHYSAERRRDLLKSNLLEEFAAQHKSADDQFQLTRMATRRAMILEVQRKISLLEHERFAQAFQASYCNDHAQMDWIPPERPSVISLSEEDVTSDMKELLLPTSEKITKDRQLVSSTSSQPTEVKDEKTPVGKTRLWTESQQDNDATPLPSRKKSAFLIPYT